MLWCRKQQLCQCATTTDHLLNNWIDFTSKYYPNRHWDTFYSQQDLETLYNSGISHLRIPVGHWLVDVQAGEPYPTPPATDNDGQRFYLKRLMIWADQIGLRVIVFFKQIPEKKYSAIPGLFFFIFVISISWQYTNVLFKSFPRLDLNRRPLVLEAIALPIESQPLPNSSFLKWVIHNFL